MKVLVISDSHGEGGLISKAFGIEMPDAVIFLGDGLSDFLEFRDYELPGNVNTFLVTGNCDTEYLDEYVYRQVAVIGGVSFLLTHGDRYNVRYDLMDLCSDAYSENCSIALYGHTHVQKKSQVMGVTAVNPGALNRGDYAVITTSGGKAEISLRSLPFLKRV